MYPHLETFCGLTQVSASLGYIWVLQRHGFYPVTWIQLDIGLEGRGRTFFSFGNSDQANIYRLQCFSHIILFNFHYVCVCLVTQSCLTLCDPMDCSRPGSSVYGIYQARILEWVAISFSRESSQPRDWTLVSCIAGGFFTTKPQLPATPASHS